LRDVAAQFHPAIVFHLFDFQRSGEVGVVINKTALLSLRLRGGGRWAIKAPSAAKSGAVVIIMMAAIAANFFILSLPLMSVRSPLNRVILNNFLRENLFIIAVQQASPEGLLALSRREYAHFTGRRRQADWRWT
jgi:hypothetical protein